MTSSATVSPTTEQPNASRRTAGWAILALALGGFGIGTTEFATMGILPLIAHGLGTSISTAGLVITAYAMGVVVGAPLISTLTARLPRKTLLLALMGLFVIGNAASALAPSISMLILARFVAGLPHGAFFGVGSVVGSHLVGPQRKGRAVSLMMAGLTVANILGVPGATLVGQHFGWRAAFLIVGAIGLITLLALMRWVPKIDALGGTSMRRELTALKRLDVWLTVLTGAVGFGGMFAVYSYIAPIMTHVSGLSADWLPLVLAIFGVGMTLGNLLGGRLTDHSLSTSLLVGFASIAAIMTTFALVAHNPWLAIPTVFLIGVSAQFIGPAIQIRLIESSPDAPSLAASMSHSALNIANAGGAWLGGAVIAAGFGLLSPAWVAVILGSAGLLLAIGTEWRHRRPAVR
ncbi:MFS transporter [Spelaeicoccus albus]|uniref:DHA1 family inner membrane transport protein n=1 Tax=Spelaeicoccus albus TaxID=1280376 RepID=A0A7Z0D242_9MICO|nr:MFS transporter [Spelaeicoccus albus]NYI67469.1 DHA1 family inner membrane transport protein [Spelaeicoccus albus]